MFNLQDSLSPEQRRLLKLFGKLGPGGRDTLLAFAEFLSQREETSETPDEPAQGAAEPRPIPRPREESVVAAIKRLSETYYMLDRRAVLNDTSALMASHVMEGRPAEEVIDQLEELFAQRYEQQRPPSGD